MTLNAMTLASGDGWYVQDVICTAGPRDPAFEEQHGTVALAAVMSGTFQYRTPQGTALLAPGAVLLGNHGCCFECGHDHGTGDRCLSFHFAPGYWEDLVAATPGARKVEFEIPSVPPVSALIPMIASLEAARGMDQAAFEEVALTFAGVVLSTTKDLRPTSRSPSALDQRRVSEALRWIEEEAHDPGHGTLSLGQLAAQAGVSPCHFLRTFRALVGTTPYQYVLRTRMNRAAVNLRRSVEAISTVACEAGFDDLSTFNRRFRSVMGASPGAYRRSYRR